MTEAEKKKVLVRLNRSIAAKFSQRSDLEKIKRMVSGNSDADAMVEDLETLVEREQTAEDVCTRLGHCAPVPASVGICDRFIKAYDTGDGFFSSLSKWSAIYDAEQQIKSAILECNKMLAEKQMCLLARNQELIIEMEKIINHKAQKREERRLILENLEKLLREYEQNIVLRERCE